MQRRPSPVLVVHAIFFFGYVSHTKNSLFYDKWQSLAIFKTNKYIPVTGFLSKTPKVFQSVLCFIEICEPYHSSYGKFPYLLLHRSREFCKIRIKSTKWRPLPLGIWQGIPVPRSFPDHIYRRYKLPSTWRCSFLWLFLEPSSLSPSTDNGSQPTILSSKVRSTNSLLVIITQNDFLI